MATTRTAAVQQLGYLGLTTSDLDAWVGLCRAVLDCEVLDEEAGDEVDVRIDNRHHRITLRQAEHDGLDYLGWEVADSAALDQIGARLEAAGFQVSTPDIAASRRRRVAGLLRTVDPSGVPLELYHGSTIDETDFAPRWPHSGFVAGELGLGHAVLATPRYEETVHFYVEILGFKVSDYIHHPAGWDSTFLRCNQRHHSLALVRQPDQDAATSLHHFLLESKTLDDVGRVLDKCLSSGIRVTQSLGRHINDLMVSFYLATPSGFEIEYGALGRLIDDAEWDVTSYAAPSIWGHLPREGFTITNVNAGGGSAHQNAYTMGR